VGPSRASGPWNFRWLISSRSITFADTANRTFALHQKSRYSINSSAASGSLSGTVSPRSFTVLRLIASSNVVGCGTGSCDGLAPLRIRPA
jgi:hypothetical protein